MQSAELDNETRFLERLMTYREEYRSRRAAELDEERARRHAGGEVYIAGCWVLKTDAERVARSLQRHEILVSVELVVALTLFLGMAAGLWSLFGFLFLP